MDRTDFNRASLTNALLLFLLIGTAILAGFLAIENHQLKNPLEAGYVKPETAITTVEVSVGGNATPIDCTTSVLFILSADCPHCRNTIPAWNAVAKTARDEGWKVMGILVGGTEADADRVFAAGADFVVLLSTDKKLPERLNLTGVPTTLVIHEGRVINGWTGEPESGFYEDVINTITSPSNI